MAQQTAVQRLEQQIRYYISNDELLDDMFEQAKAMEKEQIMQSYNDGKSAVIHTEQNKSLETYYNENYNK